MVIVHNYKFEDIYNNIDLILESRIDNNNIIAMGHFIAVVDEDSEDNIDGIDFGLGERNGTGYRYRLYHKVNNLVVTNNVLMTKKKT